MCAKRKKGGNGENCSLSPPLPYLSAAAAQPSPLTALFVWRFGGAVTAVSRTTRTESKVSSLSLAGFPGDILLRPRLTRTSRAGREAVTPQSTGQIQAFNA